MGYARGQIERLLEPTGIRLNGSQPYDIRVHDERLYRRVLTQGSLGFGEAYMDGWWESEHIDELVFRLTRSHVERRLVTPALVLAYLSSKVINKASPARAFEIGRRHYDIGNDLFESMLDKRMTYTCAYWKGLEYSPQNLDRAQDQKLDLVCRKIGLKPGQTVLDIGGGWGSFAGYAAEKYGAKVTVITVSKEQVALGKKRLKGLPVRFELKDYRDATGSYDHVVSLGMFEHVGTKNYAVFMDVVGRVLKPEGLFLLHTIGHNRLSSGVDPWIEKYIFPGGIIPQSRKLAAAAEGRFVIEDWHNFGAHYDPTLMAWYHRFESAWPKLEKAGYDERFHRMWRYYLLTCAGAFRARNIQLWQLVLSRGKRGGYESIR